MCCPIDHPSHPQSSLKLSVVMSSTPRGFLSFQKPGLASINLFPYNLGVDAPGFPLPGIFISRRLDLVLSTSRGYNVHLRALFSTD